MSTQKESRVIAETPTPQKEDGFHPIQDDSSHKVEDNYDDTKYKFQVIKKKVKENGFNWPLHPF